jgi:hypothetical protein
MTASRMRAQTPPIKRTLIQIKRLCSRLAENGDLSENKSQKEKQPKQNHHQQRQYG